jgi:hypothetical protein
MKQSRLILALIIFFLLSPLLLLPVGLAAQASASAPPPLLPQSFGGWQLSGEGKFIKDATTADPAEAPLLREYGFQELENATYEQNGRQLKLKALRFRDASGALGAFLYYRQSRMVDESIGDLASSFNEHVLFYRGNIVVDAVFDKLTMMSAAQLRELAEGLPLAPGGDRKPPALPNYLPHELSRAPQIENSTRYAAGPVALEKIGAPLSAELVDFAAGAEVVLSKYRSDPEEATLTLIEYPTPQIATEHQKRIEAAHHPANAQQNPNGPALVNLDQIYTRRTGPIVIVVSGLVTPNAAGTLLGSVNYDADVTWNERWSFNKNDNLGYVILNVVALSAVLGAITLVFGIGFGFARVALSRLFPGRIRTVAQGQEFISLHLGGPPAEPPPAAASRSSQTG